MIKLTPWFHWAPVKLRVRYVICASFSYPTMHEHKCSLIFTLLFCVPLQWVHKKNTLKLTGNMFNLPLWLTYMYAFWMCFSVLIVGTVNYHNTIPLINICYLHEQIQCLITGRMHFIVVISLFVALLLTCRHVPLSYCQKHTCQTFVVTYLKQGTLSLLGRFWNTKLCSWWNSKHWLEWWRIAHRWPKRTQTEHRWICWNQGVSQYFEFAAGVLQPVASISLLVQLADEPQTDFT